MKSFALLVLAATSAMSTPIADEKRQITCEIFRVAGVPGPWDPMIEKCRNWKPSHSQRDSNSVTSDVSASVDNEKRQLTCEEWRMAVAMPQPFDPMREKCRTKKQIRFQRDPNSATTSDK